MRPDSVPNKHVFVVVTVPLPQLRYVPDGFGDQLPTCTCAPAIRGDTPHMKFVFEPSCGHTVVVTTSIVSEQRGPGTTHVATPCCGTATSAPSGNVKPEPVQL